MVLLTVYNSTSKLEGLSFEQFKALKSILSYSISSQEAFYTHQFSKERFLLTKSGEFPTGLLYLVLKYFNTDIWGSKELGVSDRRIKPKGRYSYVGKFDQAPYPEQIEAANACVNEGRGIVVAPTGVGKSLIAALIIEKLGVSTLVVVPGLQLKEQLTESLRHVFGKLVGGLGEMIAVENVEALDPKKVLSYNCVIIDEFHHSGAATYQKLNKIAFQNVYYKFGLTATPFRSDEDERLLLESVLSKVIYRIEYKTAVDKGYILPLEAYYIEVPKLQIVNCNTVKDDKGKMPSPWSIFYDRWVVNNMGRNNLIKKLQVRLSFHERSSIFLVKEIQHGVNIQTGYESFINGIHGSTYSHAILRDFNLCKIKTLVGTSIIGEGVDTKPAEFIVICGLGKSKNAFMQQCGRGMRTYPGKESCKVIIFKDDSHKWSKAHFKAQVKYLKDEYGAIPVKLPGELP